MKKKAAGARVVLSFIWHFEIYIYILYYIISMAPGWYPAFSKPMVFEGA